MSPEKILDHSLEFVKTQVMSVEGARLICGSELEERLVSREQLLLVPDLEEGEDIRRTWLAGQLQKESINGVMFVAHVSSGNNPSHAAGILRAARGSLKAPKRPS